MDVYAGTAVQTTVTFSVAGGTVTDPTTITLKFGALGQPSTTWTYGGAGGITRVSTGIYAATLDTTGMSDGEIFVEWIGTDACAAAQVVSFGVQVLPV